MFIMESCLLETFRSSLIVTCTKRKIVDKYRDVFLKRGYTVHELNFVRLINNATCDPLVTEKNGMGSYKMTSIRKYHKDFISEL